MTGLELFKAPGTTAGEIADIVSNPCPPIVPETCDHFSCRDCWLAWLKTGEAAAPPMSGCVIPKKEEAPGNQVPPEWEQRWVTTFGVDIEGKRYNSTELMAHIGKIVLVKHISDAVIIQTLEGQRIGEVIPYLE